MSTFPDYQQIFEILSTWAETNRENFPENANSVQKLFVQAGKYEKKFAIFNFYILPTDVKKNGSIKKKVLPFYVLLFAAWSWG